jgi:pimeloyl-ACP methyl ester carboxylesterase
MSQRVPGDRDAGGRFIRLDDVDLHVVEDGTPGAPGLLLIHGTAGSTAWWDPVVPELAGACRVIRVDLAGHGRSSSPAGGYDIDAHARRVGAALDRLGAGQVTVIGHSMGCMVATALAEQRPGRVAALALIDMGPSLDAANPEGPLVRLLLARFPGRLLWRLRTEHTIRKALRSAFARPVGIPGAIIEAALGMTHAALAETARGAENYLRQRSLPDRLAALGVPVLVIFGIEDARYPSSSAAAYRAVPGARVELLPGVGHTPMMEDPHATGALLLEFAATAAQPGMQRPAASPVTGPARPSGRTSADRWHHHCPPADRGSAGSLTGAAAHASDRQRLADD